MKTLIDFEAITLRGKAVSQTVEMTHPDFVEIDEEVSVRVNGKLTKVPNRKSVEEQIIDWLDDFDKSDLIYDNDWHCIVDYRVHVKPEEPVDDRVKVLELVGSALSTDEMKASFLLIYSRLYEKIKALSVDDQIRTVMEAFLLATEAQVHTSKEMLAIFKGEKRKQDPQLERSNKQTLN